MASHEWEQETYYASPEQIDAEVTRYLRAGEFRSPRWLAAGDLLDRVDLIGLWEHGLAEGEKRDPNAQIRNESRLRIWELELAIVHRQMANRKRDIRGYANAMAYLQEQLDRLETACFLEVQAIDTTATVAEQRQQALAKRDTLLLNWRQASRDETDANG